MLQKRFCLRCMVSFSNEELHVCEGRCRKCLQHYSDHDGTTVIEDGREAAWWCGECGRDFRNDFCFAAHSRVGLREGGRFANFCELLSTLDQCQRCMEEFELVHHCRHKKIGKEPYLMMEKDKEETSSSDAAIVPNRMKEGHRTISVFCLRGIPYLGMQGNVRRRSMCTTSFILTLKVDWR